MVDGAKAAIWSASALLTASLAILRPDQPLLVRKSRLLERPAHAEIAYQTSGKRGTHRNALTRIMIASRVVVGSGFGACPLRGMGWSILTRFPSVSVNETYRPTPGISIGSPST